MESTSSDGSRGTKCSMHVGWMNNTKTKSRYVVKDFANVRGPTTFAAASDTAVGRVVEFKAVIKIAACSRSMRRQRTHMLGRTNLSFWNRHRKRLRNMVIACGGRSE